MRYSLQLIAERLCNKGFRALAMNARSSFVSKVRLLPGDGRLFDAETLYVCGSAPDEALASMCDKVFGGTPCETSAKTPDMVSTGAPDAASVSAPDEEFTSALNTASDDVLGNRGEGAACSFAFPRLPGRDWRAPSLVIDGVADAPSLLNAVSDVIDELDSAFDRMNDFAWKEGGLSYIVEELSALVGNSVYIVDSSFKVMAITHDPDLEEMSVNWMNAAKRGYLSYDVIANLIRSNELHDIESSSEATIVNSEFFYVPFANYNLRQAGKVQGHLFVVQMYRVISQCDLELVNAAAPIVLRALQADPAYQARRGPLYEHFVIDWLTGGLSDPSYIQSQLDALSFDAAALSVVAIVRLSVDSDFRREHLARLLEDRHGCRAVSHDGQVIALFQLKGHKEKADVLHKVKAICRKQQCSAVVSDVQDSFLDTPRGYRQACETQRICDAMGFGDGMTCYGDVAAYQPYLNFTSVDELEAFCHPAVIALREHDSTHAVQLLPTLSAYLKNDRDALKTAAELYVHRNTLTYRMKRILELCPLDLDDFNVRHRVLESILVVENRAGIIAYLER